jgi:hypothetical protein
MARRAVFSFALLALWAGPRASAEAHDRAEELLLTRALRARLHDTPAWRALLHYRPTPNGTWRSSADGPGFFLAGRRGKVDPRAELLATLRALRREPPPPTQRHDPTYEGERHAQCRFPARWVFLRQALAITDEEATERPCPRFAEWRQALSAEKVTLVFASAYVNSPASMYGHTFLRLSRSTGEGNPLLDYAINFAADIDTKNGLVYAIKGVLGGFKGHFYAMPYYVKIQEYSNMESRDLWEYDLSLTPPQVETLVRHVWETRGSHFDYYFQSENCSYFLLELLEVADPTLRLSERFPNLVKPVDTVRAILAVPGLVVGQRSRPSLRELMLARKRALTSSEVGVAEALAARGKGALPHLDRVPRDRRAQVIDAAYDRLRYKEGLRWPPTPFFETTERELLIARGKTGLPPQPVRDVEVVDAPERGHRSHRLGLAFGVHRATGPFQELQLRLAIHDYLDPARGYPADAQLEMAHLRLRLEDRERRVLVERFSLLDIVSAAPADRWLIKPSWRVWAGLGHARELPCDGWGCLFGGVLTGGGLALRPHRAWLVLAMLEATLVGGAPFEDGYRVGGGPSLTTVVSWGRWVQTLLEARQRWFLAGDRRHRPDFMAGQAINLGSRAQLRLVARGAGLERRGHEASVELLGYF